MDISDGLSLDLHRLCLASNMSADIVPPPRFPGASPEQALHGGEEYELMFCVRHGTRVPAKLDGLALTRIGVITSGSPGEIRLEGKPLEPHGFDHFRAEKAR
jgi:thiamine-monophosphate kinase